MELINFFVFHSKHIDAITGLVLLVSAECTCVCCRNNALAAPSLERVNFLGYASDSLLQNQVDGKGCGKIDGPGGGG